VVLVLLSNDSTSNEVGEPERVEGGELLNFEGLVEPVFPVIVVLVIDHTAHSLKQN
jgi:hypothetical protein